jgi:hypothetical protein
MFYARSARYITPYSIRCAHYRTAHTLYRCALYRICSLVYSHHYSLRSCAARTLAICTPYSLCSYCALSRFAPSLAHSLRSLLFATLTVFTIRSAHVLTVRSLCMSRYARLLALLISLRSNAVLAVSLYMYSVRTSYSLRLLSLRSN